MRSFANHAACLAAASLSASILAMMAATPALAQQAPAQDTAEIIVTAQKRPEKL